MHSTNLDGVAATVHPVAEARRQLIIYQAAVFDPDDVVEVRVLHPSKETGAPKPASLWLTACELPGLAARMADWADQGYGVHVGANPRRSFGARTNAGVAAARCVFVDFDGVGPDEALMRWESAGLPDPMLVIRTGRGTHIYLRLDWPTRDLAAWTELQKDIIRLVDGDPVVHNPERVMRLPGSVNTKYQPAVACDATRRTPWAVLRCVVPSRPKQPAPVPPFAPRLPRDSDDGDFWLQQALSRADSFGRHAGGWWLACQLRDAGLSVSDAEAVAARYAAGVHQTDHPYREAEAMTSVRGAYRSAPRARAARRGAAKTAVGPLSVRRRPGRQTHGKSRAKPLSNRRTRGTGSVAAARSESTQRSAR